MKIVLAVITKINCFVWCTYSSQVHFCWSEIHALWSELKWSFSIGNVNLGHFHVRSHVTGDRWLVLHHTMVLAWGDNSTLGTQIRTKLHMLDLLDWRSTLTHSSTCLSKIWVVKDGARCTLLTIFECGLVRSLQKARLINLASLIVWWIDALGILVTRWSE